MQHELSRNLGADLLRVTEAAALAAAAHVGRGDKEAGDQAAVDAMRAALDAVAMDGVVVIGEGEKDEAPMLYNGERVGAGRGPAADVAVDPVEGTRLLAEGQPGALAVIAAGPRGSLWRPGASLYMNKIVVGEEAKGAVDIARTPAENLRRIAEALERGVDTLTVFVLDKPRHVDLIAEIRAAGARVALRAEGDVMGALLAALPGTGVDALMGIGGTPEGVLSAVAVRALRGGMQGTCAPQDEDERCRIEAGPDGRPADAVLALGDLAGTEDAFFAATAITDSSFLDGVRFGGEDRATTHSVVLRSASGSVRFVESVHRLGRARLAGAGRSQAAASVAP